MKEIEITGWMLVEKTPPVSYPSVNPQFGGLLPIYGSKKEALFAAKYHNDYLLLKNRKSKPRKFVAKFVKITT